MQRYFTIAAVAVGLLTASASSVNAAVTTIDFETGVSASSSLLTTPAVTSEYQSLGLTFEGAPYFLHSTLGGGHILDWRQAFGVTAWSGNDFLAFNPAVTDPGERVTFANPVTNVSL